MKALLFGLMLLGACHATWTPAPDAGTVAYPPTEPPPPGCLSCWLDAGDASPAVAEPR